MAVSTLISDGAFRTTSPRQPAAGPSAAERDLWIFRDGSRSVSGPELVTDLRNRVARCGREPNSVLDSLIQAGELEAALEDAGCTCATTAARTTDALALALCTGDIASLPQAALDLDECDVPSRVSVSPPEGFTYYALHPLDYSRVVAQLAAGSTECAVIGIRSIGTTLSAVVLAALKRDGRPATRITVRPTGHPYSRHMDFSAGQQRWIHQNPGAQFLIVDEGPGRSGSTFLSVAEALLRIGIPREHISLIGSRLPEVESLCADDAAARWREFRFIATTPSVNRRFEGCTYIGGGDWRKSFLPQELWPESWTQMERLKFISPDGEHLHKFEGMGPIGAQGRVRSFALADGGFGPMICDAAEGFLTYALVRGRRMGPEEAGTEVLNRVAEYCAFRHSEFPCRWSEPSQLKQMLEFNVQQEFQIPITLPDNAFHTDRAVVTDGRMQPYEWIATGSNIVKTDGVDHGDNHFFPGPCDIAWDLAGTAVEWELGPPETGYLIGRFRQLSGVDVTPRFLSYALAYSVFRLGFCKMGISTVRGTGEEERLRIAYARYRSIAHQLALERLARQAD